MKLIDQDTLVAEIERRKNICQGVTKANENNEFTHLYYKGKTEAYSEMSEFLDTLEVKEVDLDKELNKYFITNNLIAADIQFEPVTQMKKCAQYFFELGLKAQKGE